MNAIAIFRAALIALALPFAANAQMVPANERVRVEVQIVSDNDHKDIAKTSVDQITQNKTLTIKLSGKPKSPDTRVIKWTAYGRNVKSNSCHNLIYRYRLDCIYCLYIFRKSKRCCRKCISFK